MPPKRRTAAASAGGDSLAKKTKKVADDNGVAAIKHRWEYEGKADKWIVHSDECSEDIDNALDSNKRTVSINVHGDAYQVKLDKLVQLEVSTKSEHKIRCCFSDSGHCWHTWDCESDRKGGDWVQLNVSTALVAENAFQNGLDEVDVKVGRFLCVVDLRNMLLVLKKSGKSSALRRTKSDAKVVSGPDDDEEEEPEESEEVSEEEEEDEKSVKTLVVKGKAPVDELCASKIGSAHVYCEGDDVYNAMLNQTNLQHNNNKFYVLQLLEEDSGATYSVWFRWGRVGNAGQKKLVSCGADLAKAKSTFCQKFKEKTKNEWDGRADFVKVPGKYDMVHIDYNAPSKPDEVDAGKPEAVRIPESKLEASIKDLVELICNVKAMEEAVIEMKYDARKAPLGKLSTEQLKAGYLALKQIEELIGSKAPHRDLVDACNHFYTRIPHNFGMKAPPVIASTAEIVDKLQLLEALGDIQVALRMIDETKGNRLENPVDCHYRGLECDLKALPAHSKDYKMVEQYLQTTHEASHQAYRMQLVEVFECAKRGEDDKFVDLGNRMLLWHGSRLTNWAGILRQGLRIAPPEAPVTGYMFGKGVYFADRSSKSANYCCTTRTNDTGLLLLCEVSLGSCNELVHADYAGHDLPAGKQSVKGLGLNVPDDSLSLTTSDGTVVPLGRSRAVKGRRKLDLLYNEYVVYDTKQVRMRYLVKVKFVFK